MTKKKVGKRGIEFQYTKKPWWWKIQSITYGPPCSMVCTSVWYNECGVYHVKLEGAGNTSHE